MRRDKMTEKKEITKVMLLSLAYYVKEKKIKTMSSFLGLGGKSFSEVEEEVEHYENYILPLDNFEMIEEEHIHRLVLKGKGLKIPKRKYIRATLSLSNDARMTWASDWSDLGCFRLVYKLFFPKIKVVGHRLIIESKTRDRDLTIPDRTRWI
jgi:hypothetical protein